MTQSEPRPGPDGTVEPGDVVMAFSFVAPKSSVGAGLSLVRFRTIDSGRQDAIVIDRDDAHS
ncbi:hypothetical protein ACFV19_13070 [Streptomyces griseoluteus]|uniref:hypothetical protein n=1 Tax=Streptomyces griseoluteus TaxID=29306 RepID=UPI00369628F2